ncbi:MAG: hypothetical protein HY566_01700 [Candidatus Kerfeldbacteria bacterium]|nr:hypothetical protein [Candidatus Kerfeldbacteria bacterium]
MSDDSHDSIGSLIVLDLLLWGCSALLDGTTYAKRLAPSPPQPLPQEPPENDEEDEDEEDDDMAEEESSNDEDDDYTLL